MEIFKELKKYGEKDIYPYHMPGHKRKGQSYFPEETAAIDLTEVEGTDNLHEPEGIIKEAQEYCAKAVGADHSYFLVNGSTAGVLAAISAVAVPGNKLLIARNSHRSAYNAIAIRNLNPIYIIPETDEEWDFCRAVTPEEVRRSLKENPDAAAVFIVSPTYEGCICKVKEIADAVHEYGIPLIVDEAHGAHLPFLKGSELSACRAGADIVIQSTHKTLPAPTQTALLHINGSIVDRYRIEKFLKIYQSSSPSYPLMAGIDGSIRLMASEGDKLLKLLSERFSKFVLRINQELENISAYPYTKDEHDAGKLLVSASKNRKLFLTGKELANILRERFGNETEMSTERYVLAMFTVSDDTDAYDRLFDALKKIDEELKERVSNGYEGKDLQKIILPLPEIMLSPGNALEAETEEILPGESEGRISADFIGLYPPGTPLLAGGEKITAEHTEIIKKYLNEGLGVSGLKDNKIRVVR